MRAKASSTRRSFILDASSDIILRCAVSSVPCCPFPANLSSLRFPQSVTTRVPPRTDDIISRPFPSRSAVIEPEKIRAILEQVKDGALSIDEAYDGLRLLPYQDLGFAKIDHHRALRKGVPEVVFGEGKSVEQIASIAKELADQAGRFMVTRTTPEAFEAVSELIPDASYNESARIIWLDRREGLVLKQGIAILAAGTADLPVAEEAAITCRIMGHDPLTLYDVGVAGIHRLLSHVETLQKARVIVAVAGMEGALPSVVGGLVQAPVIAVPTSIGYGVGIDGLGALMTMLNSCSQGVAVVNIDNGFGAGYLAAVINQTRA